MTQHLFPYSARPTSTTDYNMDKNVGFLDRHISELEQVATRVSPSCRSTTSRAFLSKVFFFKATKPTPKPCGVNFANRVLAVQFRVRNFFSEMNLEPLVAFAERQSNLVIETANMRIDVSLVDIHIELEKKTWLTIHIMQEANFIQEAKAIQQPDQADEKGVSKAKTHVETNKRNEVNEGESLQDSHRPITPISPITSPSPAFSVPILSLNTSTRHLITKEGSPPFNLVFNHGTRHYDLIDSNHHPSYFLHTFHPLNLKVAAWTPGSLQVHTQTKDYVKKMGTGEFMNFSVRDVEGLEKLMEELKGCGVEVLKMQ
ncbi:MAG: hypothetical protein Q9226_006540, partial [Calogaya cf. arnoldii]